MLRLNAESERFLSPLTLPRLAEFHAWAAYHRVVVLHDAVVAFLLAFREGLPYDSSNYRWFSRHARYLYIDRVVVGATHQGHRYGALLYDDLFSFARESGAERVVCEFDIDPPNEKSRRFHAHFGFREVGTQRVVDGTKQVSLQEAPL
jgi:predicted GNAT superfamily acetyltransferase